MMSKLALGAGGGWSQRIHTQEAENGKCVCLIQYLGFTQSRTSAHEIVPLLFRVVFPALGTESK